MKNCLFIFIIFSANIFARSGDGAGNGGAGYVCERISDKKNISLTLDIAEELSSHFTPKELAQSYNKDYFLAHELLESVRLDFYLAQLQLQGLFDKFVDIKELRNLKILTESQIAAAVKAKYDLIHHTKYTFYLNRPIPEPYTTQDTGKIKKLTKRTAKRYGLKNCELYQIMSLSPYHHDYEDFKYVLNIHETSFRPLNDYNLKALLWHEVIYLALGEQTSKNTRRIVSKLMLGSR